MSEGQQEQEMEPQRDVFTFVITLLFICLVAALAHGFFEYGARRAAKAEEEKRGSQVKPEQPSATNKTRKARTAKAGKKRGSRTKAQ